jgi:hypothetical protein
MVTANSIIELDVLRGTQALCKIIKIQAKDNLEQAFKTAQSLNELVPKALILSKIARMQAKIDLKQAEVYLKQAIDVAQSISIHNLNDDDDDDDLTLFSKMIYVLAKVNHEQATTISNAIPPNYLKIKCLCKIAQSQLQTNSEQAKVYLEQAIQIIRSSTFPDFKDQAFQKDVIPIQGQLDFDQAMENARSIINPFQKELAFVKLSKAQAKINLQQAIQIAQLIKDNFERGQAFYEISKNIKIQTQADLKQAKEILSKMMQSTIMDSHKVQCIYQGFKAFNHIT